MPLELKQDEARALVEYFEGREGEVLSLMRALVETESPSGAGVRSHEAKPSSPRAASSRSPTTARLPSASPEGDSASHRARVNDSNSSRLARK